MLTEHSPRILGHFLKIQEILKNWNLIVLFSDYNVFIGNQYQKHNFVKSSKTQKLDNKPGINACIKEEVSIETKINRIE